jgi:hypothetical protein
LLPVLKSHQPGEPADAFASHLADVADVMHLHPDRRFADDAWVAQAGPRPESDVHLQWVGLLPPRESGLDAFRDLLSPFGSTRAAELLAFFPPWAVVNGVAYLVVGRFYWGHP